jgi:thioredoxin reductase (NADPH)
METNQDSHHEVIVIGSGPAGLTAALYLARANLAPLVIEGLEAGGQLMLTTDVENYPGFTDGIMGPDLMGVFRKQAERFGAIYLTADVEEVDLASRPFKVKVRETIYTADAIVVSTGAKAKMLGATGEDKLLGRGVSTCATCDGAFFREQRLIVVGGGDSAMEEAIFLTRFASKVTVVHRRDELRASKIMQQRAFDNPKIDFIWDSVLDEIVGDQKVAAVKIRNVKTDEVTEMDVEGVFIAIGHIPNTSLFEGTLETDASGYLKVAANLGSDPLAASGFATRTNVEGVFASGDVVDSIYRQAVTAAGMGCMAAIDAERWLESQAH